MPLVVVCVLSRRHIFQLEKRVFFCLYVYVSVLQCTVLYIVKLYIDALFFGVVHVRGQNNGCFGRMCMCASVCVSVRNVQITRIVLSFSVISCQTTHHQGP